MSYVVLARKYRPRRFSEVVGQAVITRTLRGAISEGRVAHAYLFSGSRGTGKTTTARILAQLLNCEEPGATDPCGACTNCKAVEAGGFPDIIEIDAASHTGVDNIRDLRDQAAYTPMRGRAKVYIVDEVHMLSKSAFNALLKTLEEPPAHVTFLFATTELHKVPDTILSRCQVLTLSPLTEEAIAGRLDAVFVSEGVRAGEGVTPALARRARGGMRDALSLADQLLALVGDEPTLEDVSRLSAASDREQIEELVSAVVEGERARLLELVLPAVGAEGELCDAFMARLREALICAHCGADSPLVEATAESRQALSALAQRLGPERIELMLEELLHARERIARLPGQARLILESSLLALAREEHSLPLAELVNRLAALEARLGGAAPVAVPAQAAQAAGAAPAPRSGAPEVRPAPRPAVSERVARSSNTDAWQSFLKELMAEAPTLGEVLDRCGQLVEYGGGRAVIRVERIREADRALVTDARNRRRCALLFSRVVGEDIDVSIEDGGELRPGAEDPFTNKVADLFGGRIED